MPSAATAAPLPVTPKNVENVRGMLAKYPQFTATLDQMIADGEVIVEQKVNIDGNKNSKT